MLILKYFLIKKKIETKRDTTINVLKKLPSGTSSSTEGDMSLIKPAKNMWNNGGNDESWGVDSYRLISSAVVKSYLGGEILTLKGIPFAQLFDKDMWTASSRDEK